MTRLKIPNVNHLIFDFDGVIADTDAGRFSLLNTLLSNYGIDLENNYTVRYLTGLSTIKFLERNFPSLSPSSIKQIVLDRRRLFFNNLELYCKVYNGAVATIKDLHRADYELSLATSNDAHMTEVLLKHFGIETFFQRVLARDQSENEITGKKDYGRVLDILRKKPSECLVIEDSPVGINSAKNAGLFCIEFNANQNNDFNKNSDITIRDYNELRQLFGMDDLDLLVS